MDSYIRKKKYFYNNDISSIELCYQCKKLNVSSLKIMGYLIFELIIYT